MKNLAMLLCLSLSGCAMVGPGDRGVRVILGSASSEAKEPGVYFWIPFIVGMAKVDVQIQKSEIEASAASSDMQEIKTHVAVNWALSPANVVETYKSIGHEGAVLDRIISPAVNEAFKSAISKKTAADVLGKRAELKMEIDDLLKARLAHYGVTLHDVSIVNLTFSEEFTKAIEKKQIAEQEAEQAKYRAQQAIEEAKAEVNLAEGRAKAQAITQASLTPAILQKAAIDKWDGHFPQSMGQQALPLLNLK